MYHPPIGDCKEHWQNCFTACDDTNRYYDQHIVEKEVFLKCDEKSGIKSNPSFKYYFPRENCATVSIHLLK